MRATAGEIAKARAKRLPLATCRWQRLKANANARKGKRKREPAAEPVGVAAAPQQTETLLEQEQRSAAAPQQTETLLEQIQRSAAAPQQTETLLAVNDTLLFIFATQFGRPALLQRIPQWRLELLKQQLRGFVPFNPWGIICYKSMHRQAMLLLTLQLSQRSEAFAIAIASA
eukprot:SAG31_NODE_2946_length_4874_cov_1.638534_2_plen_172_part_00